MCFQHVTSAPWIKQIKTHVSFVIHAKWKWIEKVTSIDSTVLLIKRYLANYILRPNHLLKISNPAIKLVKQKHSHFNMSIVRFLDETHSNSKVLKATVKAVSDWNAPTYKIPFCDGNMAGHLKLLKNYHYIFRTILSFLHTIFIIT